MVIAAAFIGGILTALLVVAAVAFVRARAAFEAATRAVVNQHDQRLRGVEAAVSELQKAADKSG